MTSAPPRPHRNLNPVTIASGAMTLIAALAWNTVARETVELVVPKKDGKAAQLFATLVYAILVTIVIIIVIYCGNAAINHLNGGAEHFDDDGSDDEQHHVEPYCAPCSRRTPFTTS